MLTYSVKSSKINKILSQLIKDFENENIVVLARYKPQIKRLRKTFRNKIKIYSLSLESQLSVYKLIAEIKPDECYHLAASSFVNYDFGNEIPIISANFISTHYLLSSIKELSPQCHFYFAGSSEIFGSAEVSPQNEYTNIFLYVR